MSRALPFGRFPDSESFGSCVLAGCVKSWRTTLPAFFLNPVKFEKGFFFFRWTFAASNNISFISMQELFITKNASEATLVYYSGMHPGGRPTVKNRSTLGQRLTEARVKAGLSQAKVAELMGTTQPAVAYWERSAENLRSDVLTRLAEILEVSTDELLGAQSKRSRVAKPAGKARQLFDAVSKMPRRQQDKILAVLEPFVTQHTQEREA